MIGSVIRKNCEICGKEFWTRNISKKRPLKLVGKLCRKFGSKTCSRNCARKLSRIDRKGYYIRYRIELKKVKKK